MLKSANKSAQPYQKIDFKITDQQMWEKYLATVNYDDKNNSSWHRAISALACWFIFCLKNKYVMSLQKVFFASIYRAKEAFLALTGTYFNGN
jgi:site-specific recombinase XerD